MTFDLYNFAEFDLIRNQWIVEQISNQYYVIIDLQKAMAIHICIKDVLYLPNHCTRLVNTISI